MTRDVFRPYYIDHEKKYIRNSVGLFILVTLFFVFIGTVASIQKQNKNRERNRSILSTLRNRLEYSINSNFLIIYNIAAHVSLHPEAAHEEFYALAEQLFRQYNNLKNVVIAPDLIIKDVYPLEGNEAVLITLAILVGEKLRRTDIFGRWSGEEFLIICPGTNLEGAAFLSETLRKVLESHNFKSVGPVTCSFGVASSEESGKSEDLLKKLDNALYFAKQNGRNRVATTRDLV